MSERDDLTEQVFHSPTPDEVQAAAYQAADAQFKESPLAPENEQRAEDYAEGFQSGARYTEADAEAHMPPATPNIQLGTEFFTPAQWEIVSAYARGYHQSQSREHEMSIDYPFSSRQQNQVAEFHAAMGQPVGWRGPHMLDEGRKPVRVELIREEFIDELIPALAKHDYVETVDALIDLLYVVNGTLVEMGVDSEPLFDEVHRSNMSKFGEDGKPIIAGPNDPDGIFEGRVKKGPNYFKPSIAGVLVQLRDKAAGIE